MARGSSRLVARLGGGQRHPHPHPGVRRPPAWHPEPTHSTRSPPRVPQPPPLGAPTPAHHPDTHPQHPDTHPQHLEPTQSPTHGCPNFPPRALRHPPMGTLTPTHSILSPIPECPDPYPAPRPPPMGTLTLPRAPRPPPMAPRPPPMALCPPPAPWPPPMGAHRVGLSCTSSSSSSRGGGPWGGVRCWDARKLNMSKVHFLRGRGVSGHPWVLPNAPPTHECCHPPNRRHPRAWGL